MRKKLPFTLNERIIAATGNKQLWITREAWRTEHSENAGFTRRDG